MIRPRSKAGGSSPRSIEPPLPTSRLSTAAEPIGFIGPVFIGIPTASGLAAPPERPPREPRGAGRRQERLPAAQQCRFQGTGKSR
jgi:hypothetical protein